MGANKLLYENKLNNGNFAVTPSASDENSTYPLTNCYVNNYADVYRSNNAGASDIELLFDFGADVTLNAIGLGNVNFQSTATVKIQGHTADSWGAPDIDQTIDASDLDGYRRCLYYDLDSSASKRYWRLVISDDGNPDGFIEIGEIFLGEAVELTDSYDKNIRQRLMQNHTQMETEYSQLYTYTKDQIWAFDLSWTNCQQSTVDQLLALTRYVEGSAKPFFWVLDANPGEADNPAEAYFVRIQNVFEQSRINFNRFNLKMLFMEEAPGIALPR